MTGKAQTFSAELNYKVQPKDLAINWGNEFPVLATPVLLWLTEIAAMRAIDGSLGADQITLGLAHNSKHVGFSVAGREITITATVVEQNHKSLKFMVRAHDCGRLLLEGFHTRAVVGRALFEDRIQKALVG